MKVKQIFFAAGTSIAIAAAVILARSTRAESPGTTTTANSTDAMTALFGDPVIATGTGVKVKRSDLDQNQQLVALKASAATQGREIPQDVMIRDEAIILKQLIDIQLLADTANDADKADGLKKANDAISTLLQRAGSQQTLDMELKAVNKTEDQLRDEMAQQAMAMSALQRVLAATVPIAQVQDYYDAHPQDFEIPEMAHVRHILFMTIDPTTGEPLSDDAVNQKHKEAEDVLEKARSGEDFSKLAEDYSDDTTTKDKGGELPPFPRASDDPRHAMVPEFEAAAFSLTNNEISDLVKTKYGYHIIQLIDKTPARKLGLYEEIPPTNMDITVAQMIREEVFSPPYLKKLEQQSNLKILDPDLNAAVESLSITNAAAAEK